MNFGFYGNLIAVLIAALIGSVLYKNIKAKLGIIFLYVCLSAGTQLLINISNLNGIKNNLPGLHLYMLVEFSLLTLFYIRLFDDYVNRNWIYLISAVFLVYSIINTIFIQGIWNYPNIPRAIEALILILFSLIYFYKVLIESKIEKLMNDSIIWINLAVLIYFSGNFVYHILFNMILEYSRETAKTIGNLFTILNIIYYILITIGFWKERKTVEIANK